MKKYIYGTIFVAVVAAVVIFFFRPPEATNRPPQTILAITFRLPAGYEFTEGAPFVLTWRAESPAGALSVPMADRDFKSLVSPYKLVFTPAFGSKAVRLNARLYYCHKASRMCFQGDFEARVPLTAGSTVPISYIWDITPKTGNG